MVCGWCRSLKYNYMVLGGTIIPNPPQTWSLQIIAHIKLEKKYDKTITLINWQSKKFVKSSLKSNAYIQERPYLMLF
jgi:hypothetical protein